MTTTLQKVMTINHLNRDTWLLDSAADMHVCNHRPSFINYITRSTGLAGSTSDGTSPGRGMIRKTLALQDDSPSSVLILNNVLFIPQCPVNLVSLALLNQNNIYYDNVNWTLFNGISQNIIGYVPRVNTNFVLKTLDAPDVATHLMQTDESTFQWPNTSVYHTSAITDLSTWHARLGHLNLITCRAFLKRLDVSYSDNVNKDWYCSSCELGKATKIYNRTPQERATGIFQKVHSDLVGPIKPAGFLEEQYFFTFTCDASRYTHVYTGIKKSEWFDHLLTYYSLAQNKTGKSKPINIFRTDFGRELRSLKSDDWFLKEGITFEPSAPYSQEQNGVSERTGRTIMDMTRCTIIAGGIPDYLWTEVVLAMVHTKNVRPTNALSGKTPFEIYESKSPPLNHLRVLGSTVYVLIHEEERKGANSKSAKFLPRAQRGVLCGYDGCTIYRVFLEKDYRVIRVKDLRIHEDAISKDQTNVPTYEAIMTPDTVTPSKSTVISSPTTIPKRGRGRPRKHAQIEHALSLLSDTALDEPNHTPTYDDIDTEDPLVLLARTLEKEGSSGLEDYDALSQLDIAEPQTYHQAMKGPHSESWSRSMDNEHNSLLENETWTPVRTEDMEPNHTALSGKWVYKLKQDVNGNITRYKSRWVVKGYLQQYGVDFEQTYASVVKPMAFRLLFAIAAHHDLDIEQLDVVTAFLYGVIDQLIYVQMPKGYEKAGMICKLNKALYGLKQSPRLWYERLSEFLLTKLGLSKLHADHSIFSSSAGIRGPIVTSFVDDLNIIGPKGSPMISEVKKQLNIAFKMVDMGPISHYLGLKVERNRDNRTIKLSQSTYIEKVLEKFHMQNAKTTTTPMKEGSLFRNKSQASESDIKQYQAIVGSIMFAMIETRPDIAYATSVVSRHAKNPGKSHMEAAKQILRYLSATRDRGITFGGGDLSIQGYSDSDWAGDKEDRKSTSGYVFMLNNGPISWASKRQKTVALSSTEAEYMALTLAAKETIWIRLLMTELGLMQDDATPTVNVLEREGAIALKGDNQSAIALANNPVLHSRTKHIDIQHHFIRNEVTEGRIDLTYVSTEHMVADGLTKPLTHVKFFSFIRQLHMNSSS